MSKPGSASLALYGYDVLGRRISKRSENGKNVQKSFVWDGSHLAQEIDHQTGETHSYLYRSPNSYEPLAQLTFAKNSQKPTACYYYHNDQIGVPRELTDEQGKLCWRGSYNGWDKLTDEHKAQADIHQPFRLQNQYYDQETGLHYNFFRYYEPNLGRFTSLDPIGLEGGENLYAFAPNVQGWVDPLGLFVIPLGYEIGAPLLGGASIYATSTDDSHSNIRSQAEIISKTDSCVVGKCEKEKKKRCKKWGIGDPKDAMKKVKKGQGSKNISMIHAPDEDNVPGSKWHAHDFGGEALNIDGTLHHREFPNFSNDDKDFLYCHGWNI